MSCSIRIGILLVVWLSVSAMEDAYRSNNCSVYLGSNSPRYDSSFAAIIDQYTGSIVTFDSNKNLTLWDALTRKEQHRLDMSGYESILLGLTCSKRTSQQQKIALTFAGKNNLYRCVIYSPEDKKTTCVYQEDRNTTEKKLCALSPAGAILALAYGTAIQCFMVRNEPIQLQPYTHHMSLIKDLVWADPQTIVTASEDELIVTKSNGQILAHHTFTTKAQTVRLSAQQHRVVLVRNMTDRVEIVQLDLVSTYPIRVIEGGSSEIFLQQLSTDGKKMVCVARDTKLRVYDFIAQAWIFEKKIDVSGERFSHFVTGATGILPDGTYMVVLNNGSVHRFDPYTYRYLQYCNLI